MSEKYEEKVLYIEDYYSDLYMYKKKASNEKDDDSNNFQSIVLHILDEEENQ